MGKGMIEPKREEWQGRKAPALIPFKDEEYGQPTPEHEPVNMVPHQYPARQQRCIHNIDRAIRGGDNVTNLVIN